MCINISATVVLGCLFIPKVYLVLFQPNKNVRSGHTNTVSAGGGAPGGAGGGSHAAGNAQNSSSTQSGLRSTYSMRFVASRSQTMQSVTSCSRSSPVNQSSSLAGDNDDSSSINKPVTTVSASTEAAAVAAAVNGGDAQISPLCEETFLS